MRFGLGEAMQRGKPGPTVRDRTASGKHSQFAIENDHGFIVDLPIKSGGIFHCFCMFTGGVDQALL
jgi:hypothetical protein